MGRNSFTYNSDSGRAADLARWARLTEPADRSRATLVARTARHKAWLARVRANAAAQGIDGLTPRQLRGLAEDAATHRKGTAPRG
jgi:hypothetical protein